MTTIVLVLPRPTLQWHAWLKAALEQEGHQVTIAHGRRQRNGLAALQLALEALVKRGSRALGKTVLLEGRAEAVGARVVLDGSDIGGIVPFYDDAPGFLGLVQSLCRGRAPLIRIKNDGNTIAEGRPALRNAALLSGSIDDVLHKCVMLLVGVVRGSRHEVYSADVPALCPRWLQHPLGLLVRTVLNGLDRKLRRTREHWRVATRARQANQLLTVIPDDGQRYFADPFPISHAARDYIFVEEYPYASKRGVISVFERLANGFSARAVALDRPYHLSYPFLYKADSEIYMIPETGSVRRVERYRAKDFPLHWEFDCILIDDVALVDATLIEHDGRHWLFATLAEPGMSSWDCLMVYFAHEIDGPWQAHSGNPVAIDAGAARPAGYMWHDTGGRLLRVAQDCRTGYGQGTVIICVDELTPTTFRQHIIEHVRPPGLALSGLHTVNRFGGEEVIDVCERQRY